MLVPQAMAYALLAGLPPVVGLYASITPLIAYALIGTSRHLAVGPVAMVSLLVVSSVGAIAEPGSAEYIGLAIALAWMVGFIQLAMGLARAGAMVNFLAHPVVSGFTSAAALIIGLSQVKHLFGLDVPRAHSFFETVQATVAGLDQAHALTALVGLSSVAALLLMKRYAKALPRALIVVGVATAATMIWGLDARGLAVVGAVPSNLPTPTLPGIEWGQLGALIPAALTISLVGFMESYSVAETIARKKKYRLAPNRELLGLGAANVAGAIFGAYPVTGGFSRTAVNTQAGARTGLAAVITALFVALALVTLTPVLRYVPNTVLAAIIVTAVAGLFDWKEATHLYKVKRSDLALLALTFSATLAIGIEEGIAVGVAASLLAFFLRATRPHTAVLGRLPGAAVYRNVANFPDAKPVPGMLIVRMDASYVFGNVAFLRDTLEDLEANRPDDLRAVILDFSAINDLDSSAEAGLRQIAAGYRDRDITFAICNVKGPVRELLLRSGLWPDVTHGKVFLSVECAVQWALAQLEDAPGTDAEPTISDLCVGPDTDSPRRVELRSLHVISARP